MGISVFLKNLEKGVFSSFIFPEGMFSLTPLRLHMTKNRALFGNESILFVDDDAFIVLVQKTIFELYGYNVISFVSSHDALKEFKSRFEIFDIAIFDMAMPKMTGLDLAHKIKQIRPDIPVIISTGFSEKINKDSFLDMGVDGFLMKPASKEESLTLIRYLLDKR